ncbi:MAG TPA: hypothetical protein VFA07_13355 [Chthonomonadaceae bacterium]|nr:hypothetical protein [Chthonomonadaceae bacterium]
MIDPRPERAIARAADFLGEIVEASTTRFVAQCPPERLHAPPAFGAFVKVGPNGATRAAPAPRNRDPFADPTPPAPLALPAGTPDDTLYALVFSATTGSAEPGRRPTAYGLDEESLRQEQPQIFDLLCTEFAGLHVGFARDERLHPYLPPRPPRLHALVSECSPDEIVALTESLDFLRALLHAPGEGDPDELIAACLRHAYACRDRDFTFLVRAGKQLAALLHDDPDRLNALLRKLEPG